MFRGSKSTFKFKNGISGVLEVVFDQVKNVLKFEKLVETVFLVLYYSVDSEKKIFELKNLHRKSAIFPGVVLDAVFDEVKNVSNF